MYEYVYNCHAQTKKRFLLICTHLREKKPWCRLTALKTDNLHSNPILSYSTEQRSHISNFWTGFYDLGRCLIRVLLEIFYEKPAQLGHFFLEISLSCPGFGWVQQLIRYTSTYCRHREIESLVSLILRFGQFSGVDGIKYRPCVPQPADCQSNIPLLNAMRLTGIACPQLWLPRQPNRC